MARDPLSPVSTPRLRPLPSSLLAVALLAVVSCTVSVQRETPSAAGDVDERVSTIDDWAREAIDSGRVAGISLAVEKAGESILARGYGLADVENDVPATPETVYRIGSITKQFTASIIMQLVEAGQVDLDADIRDFVDYPTGDYTVTIRELLNHTSGIPSYTGIGEDFWSKSRLDLTHEELLDLVRERPFDFAPGEQWKYDNTGYYLLGMVIENVTGQPYADVLEERLFDPLELDSTTYCGERKLIAHRAEGYELDDGELVNDEALSMANPFAAGALCSTVGDLLEWQRALEAGDVVTAESYIAMTTSGSTADGPFHYGFGLGVSELEGHRKISHGGGINGFVTMLARYPDDGLRVVVLTNTPGPTAGRLEEKIARLMLGLEITEIADLPLAPEDAARYVGTYDLQRLQLRVFWRDGHLYAQATEQPESMLRYQGEDTFVPEFDDRARIIFQRGDDAVTGLTLFQGNAEIEGARIE